MIYNNIIYVCPYSILNSVEFFCFEQFYILRDIVHKSDRCPHHVCHCERLRENHVVWCVLVTCCTCLSNIIHLYMSALQSEKNHEKTIAMHRYAEMTQMTYVKICLDIFGDVPSAGPSVSLSPAFMRHHFDHGSTSLLSLGLSLGLGPHDVHSDRSKCSHTNLLSFAAR